MNSTHWSLITLSLGSGLATIVPILLTVIVNVLFTIGIAQDVDRVWRRGQDTVLVCPAAWVAATLLGGIYVAGLYWLIHHSMLSPYNAWERPSDPSPPQRERGQSLD
ncbi:hypothetical protein [Trichothermofontia sp.]